MSRWALVAAAAAAFCVLPTVVASFPVGTAHVTVGKVLASVNQPYSGYVRTQSELGLPSLPELSDVTSLLSGITDVRVWSLSSNQNRVDVIDTVGERDVYETPGGTYTWDYGQDQLTEVTGTEPVRLPRAGDLLPPDLARRVLTMDQVDPVESLPSRRIAGIDAAGLRLRPRDPATTVGQVDIWADPATGLPLRVEITARGGSQPILTSEFVSVTQSAPDESDVDPPNQPVAKVGVPSVLSAITSGIGRFFPLPTELAGYQRQPQLAGLPSVGRYGAGLATFVALPLPRTIGSQAISTALKGGGKQLAVTRGRAVLIQIPLLTVLIEQVGYRRTYLLAGFVNSTVMAQAATELSLPRRPVPFR